MTRLAVLMPQPDIGISTLGCGLVLMLVGIGILRFLMKAHDASKRLEQIREADERERDGGGIPFDETAVIPRIPAGHPLRNPLPRTVSAAQQPEIDRLNSLFRGRVYGTPTTPEEPKR